MPYIEIIKKIAEFEYSDIVRNVLELDYKLRIIFLDNSFLDVYLSQKFPDRFSFHWECLDFAKTIYRYDNFPDKRWQSISSFPHHFHKGSQNKVVASPFPLTTIEAFKAFMDFVRSKVKIIEPSAIHEV
jgi:hypothetical protein